MLVLAATMSAIQRKLRMLLAEDDPAMRLRLADCLAQIGLSVEECDGQSLRDAFDALDELEPEAILLGGVQTPIWTAIDALRWLSTSAPEIPVVVLTEDGDEAGRERARRWGAVAVLDRSAEPRDVQLAVLGATRARDAVREARGSKSGA